MKGQIVADADYDWLEERLPAVAAQLTMPEQREVLLAIEEAQGAAWDDALEAARNRWADARNLDVDNPYRQPTQDVRQGGD